MSTICERIMQIQEESNLSKSDFARTLEVTPAYISKISKGEIDAAGNVSKVNVSDRFITSICRTFNVNRHWLETGDGETYITRSREQELAEFISDIMHDEPESFRQRLVTALARLRESDWETLERIADNIVTPPGDNRAAGDSSSVDDAVSDIKEDE